MTELQAIHHAEQMDALRRDFLEFWEEIIRPMAIEEGYMNMLPAIQAGLWEQWKADHAMRGVAP